MHFHYYSAVYFEKVCWKNVNSFLCLKNASIILSYSPNKAVKINTNLTPVIHNKIYFSSYYLNIALIYLKPNKVLKISCTLHNC
jgi:hypothetical protein